MRKNTEELLEILHKSTSIEVFMDSYEDNFSDMTLSTFLEDMASKKNLTKSDIIQKSNLSAVYVYKIFAGERNPQRDKLLALAFGLELDLEKTQKMLKIADAGALYPRVRRDSIIIFALNQRTDIITCNEMLYELGEDILE
jgi:transcriptional regulator with XRE-family HTH domain